MLPLYYHSIYSDGIDSRARFPRERYRLLADRLNTSASARMIQLRQPRPATRQEILLVHDADYTERFLSGRLQREEVRRIGLRPWSDAIIERTLLLTGGSLEALDAALSSGGLAGNMAGGTHHADRSFGSGYCVFNDLAICAESALVRPQIERVLILDLDVHQGDGTARIFARDPRVLTVSVHAAKNFPARKARSDIDVALRSGIDDAEYLRALHQLLQRLSAQRFDIIFFQAGVDALAEDRLGQLNLTADGMRCRNEAVLDFQQSAGVPMVLFMGGGYSVPISHTVEAFADLFHAAAERAAACR